MSDAHLRRERLEEALLPPVVALAIALVAGDLLILTYGEAPGAVWRLMLDGTWGNAYGFGQVLYKATTLTCTGLAVAMSLRAGLFNIGAEGQLAAGGFGAALAGVALPAGTPAVLAVPIGVMAALLCGGLVGAVPGALRAAFGAHEVIVTIMLNFIVLALLNYLVSAKLHVPETLHTLLDAEATAMVTLEREVVDRPAFLSSAERDSDLPIFTSGVETAVWVNAARMVGDECVNPVADSCIQPSFSLTFVTTVDFSAPVSSTSIVALMGAEENL